MSASCRLDDLLKNGFTMLAGAFQKDEVLSLACQLSAALENGNEESILRSGGKTYGSRNLVERLPAVGVLFGSLPLRQFAAAVLKEDAGVVRALYFDKPPGQSWSLPWHKDRTIAVKKNDLTSRCFQKPTVKAGVPHVEAPEWLLKRMLTLRIHVDEMTGENGPLCVIPGSHSEDNNEPPEHLELHAQAGDVLAMRPLLSHSSKLSNPTAANHRRVIHIELAENIGLPDGYQWYSFIPLKECHN